VLLARQEPARLSEVDRLRYLAYQHVLFDSSEVAWIYHEDEVLEDATWVEWAEWFSAEARRRPVFGRVENRANFTGPGFRAHVDRILGVE